MLKRLKMDSLVEENSIVEKILELFDTSKLIDIDIQDNIKSWEPPAKSTATKFEFRGRIANNIYNCVSDKKDYDPTYLEDMFEIIDKYLSEGIPYNLSKGDGYVYPDVPFKERLDGYTQLYARQCCDKFISNVTTFNPNPQDRNAIKLFYLLGYIGSGKSTFINYMLEKNRERLNKELIVQSRIEYSDIREEIYEEKEEGYWKKRIWSLFVDKVITCVEDDAFRSPFSTDEKKEINAARNEIDKESILRKILRRYNLIIIFDGLDSLSPNKIERTNSKLVLLAIVDCLNKLESLYNNQPSINRNCHVVYSLRKCTYDMPGIPKFGRRDYGEAYFLPASLFDNLIERIIQFLLSSKQSFRENEQQIIKIVKAASEKAKLISFDSELDTFDNNYRRRLRYVASLIITVALRVSNSIGKQSGKKNDVHKYFLEQIYNNINGLKEHVVLDIFIYGVNTGFNNHFSDEKEDDNIGRLCGFVDNIFCYFPFVVENNPNVASTKMLIKLRTLQILNSKKDSNYEFKYLSLSEIKKELSAIGINVIEEEIKDVMDFLEKSLFVRSTKPYELNNQIHFKCSNHGANLLEKVLFKYSYISAIAQNICLPDRLARQFEYHKRSLNSYGSILFVSKRWVIEIIPAILFFLRLLKNIELKIPAGSKFFIHEKMIASCKEAVGGILNDMIANKKQLSTDESQQIYDKCIKVLDMS